MAYTRLFTLFISSILFLMLGRTVTASPIAYSCELLSYANRTSNSSRYLANLDLLLQSLSSKANATSGTGFYNTTVGDGADKVYGLFLCRGDLTSKECQTCIETASAEIKPLCPNNTAAVAYYDNCVLRYANQSIFSVLQQEPFRYAAALQDVTKLDQYNQSVSGLLNRLVNQAINGSFAATPKYYAAGQASYYTGFDTIYALVQCTPDITSNDCNYCLTGSVSLDVPRLLYPKQGGRILKPSCNLRFEFNSPFYEVTPSPPPTPPSTNSTTVTTGKGRYSTSTIIILVVVNVVTFIVVVIISIIYRRAQRKKVRFEDDSDDQIEISSVDFIKFNFDKIKAATNNFSDENKLGEGGFGTVYKGTLLNGQIVAVKRLSKYSEQGEIEFKNEVKLAAKLQHRNLVTILGFSLQGEEKLLVYEFLPNKSLDHYIFVTNSQLNWEERYNIIEGIARGLLYLHEDSQLKIIHRDLKASNILLDEEMNPKISDFGMARLFVADQSQANTKRVVGTYGYMAPEYVAHGQVSVKTDVFSFGVLLLEIVSGQRNSNLDQQTGSLEGGLLNQAWRKWKEGTALSLIDPKLRGNYDQSEVIRCMHIGLLCVQENVSNRPTMATVVLMLNSYSASLPLPTLAERNSVNEISISDFFAR